jgi:intraflagellar transport protein 140
LLQSGDVLSQVRIHCFQGDLASARALVDATGDRAAAFHVARQLELREDIPSAIRYFR